MSIDPNDLSIDMCGKGTSAGERVDEDIVTRLVEGTNSPSLPVRQWERLYLTCSLCALSEDVAPTPREPPRRRLGNLAITECYSTNFPVPVKLRRIIHVSPEAECQSDSMLLLTRRFN